MWIVQCWMVRIFRSTYNSMKLFLIVPKTFSRSSIYFNLTNLAEKEAKKKKEESNERTIKQTQQLRTVSDVELPGAIDARNNRYSVKSCSRRLASARWTVVINITRKKIFSLPRTNYSRRWDATRDLLSLSLSLSHSLAAALNENLHFISRVNICVLGGLVDGLCASARTATKQSRASQAEENNISAVSDFKSVPLTGLLGVGAPMITRCLSVVPRSRLTWMKTLKYATSMWEMKIESE